jgi:hypothetical protein
MANENEANIQKKIIERVLSEETKKLVASDAKDTLDVLEEMTDLPRSELEEIARNVRTSSLAASDSFFSVKMQLVLTATFIVILASLVFLIKWFF